MLQLMAEVDGLIQQLASGKISLGESCYLSYQAAFETTIGLNPHTATATELLGCFDNQPIEVPDNCDRAALLDLTMALLVEPKLPKNALVFIYHYPAAQASLAKLNQDDPSVAQRFEVFLNGMELANGFEELQDWAEQSARFDSEYAQRKQHGKALVPVDKRFLNALASGLPACSGVAIGLDRLVMMLLGKAHINDVISFPADSA
jgi:lysyl-tRNA synthetase class 2